MSSRLGPVNRRPSGQVGRGQRFGGGPRRSFGGRRGWGGGRGRGRGRGGGFSGGPAPSKEDLDAELDAYNSKMDTE